MTERLTTEAFRRLTLPDNEGDVVQQCREVAKRAGVVLSEVGQRRAKGSGTTYGFADLTLGVAGWWLPIEAKWRTEPSTAQYLLARWLREHGVDTGHVRGGQDLADIIGFCMHNPRPALVLPHSLVDYVEGKRR